MTVDNLRKSMVTSVAGTAEPSDFTAAALVPGLSDGLRGSVIRSRVIGIAGLA